LIAQSFRGRNFAKKALGCAKTLVYTKAGNKPTFQMPAFALPAITTRFPPNDELRRDITIGPSSVFAHRQRFNVPNRDLVKILCSNGL